MPGCPMVTTSLRSLQRRNHCKTAAHRKPFTLTTQSHDDDRRLSTSRTSNYSDRTTRTDCMTSMFPRDVVMTSSSLSAADDTRTSCCDVTTAAERETTTASRFANDGESRFTRDADGTITSSDGLFTSSTSSSGNGGQSRDCSATPTQRNVSIARQTSCAMSLPMNDSPLVTRDRHTGRDVAETQPAVDDVGSVTTTSAVASRLNETFANISLTASPINASSDCQDSRQPLALRSVADNASVSAAVGSNTVDRRGGSGLLREEVATVSVAVAGVVVFWSLLALAMCAAVRLHKRKRRRSMRGGDVDAQTAMMEAMVRAELARGRSRVGDSRVPTYVNVAELIPRSSSCDLNMSDFFHLVVDNNQTTDLHSVWKKHYNDNGRQHDPAAHWQDVQTREATGQRSNKRLRLNCSDDYCLRNCAKDAANSGNGPLQCNGVLTKVKSLDSVCDETNAAVDGKYRQRPRRRRVRRSASTSRCHNTPTSPVNAPANGQTRCHGNHLSSLVLQLFFV